MKQITELTEQEILALTDDHLSKMVQYKMAEAGIKILEMPDKPEYLPLPAKEVKGFRVKGIDNYFFNEEAAKQAAEIIKNIMPGMFSTECPNYDYNLNWVKPATQDVNYSFSSWGEVSAVEFYNQKTVSGIDEIVKANKDIKANYEADLKEYHEADEASADIKAMIYGTFNDVHKKYHNMAEMQYHYQRYLRLADGNETIAMNFLKAAYSIDEQTEYYVQGKEMPEIADEWEYNTTAKSEGCAN